MDIAIKNIKKKKVKITDIEKTGGSLFYAGEIMVPPNRVKVPITVVVDLVNVGGMMVTDTSVFFNTDDKEELKRLEKFKDAISDYIKKNIDRLEKEEEIEIYL